MSYRKEKLEEQIKRVISELLLKEIKDPRIGFTTITQVTLSRDYSHAKIGISVLGNASELRKTYEGINSARGFIQYRVAKNIRMRVAPKIEFFLDSSVADGVEMVNLLESIKPEDSDDPDGEDS